MTEHDGTENSSEKALVPVSSELIPILTELEKVRVKELVARAIRGVEEIQELIEINFFEIGESYSFEQLVDVATDEDPLSERAWENLNDLQKEKVLAGIGKYLGVNLLDIHSPDIFDREEDGVDGMRSEGGADVIVLKPSVEEFKNLEVHVMQYRDSKSELGTRYDLVYNPASSE